MSVQPNGALLVGGDFNSIGNQQYFSLVRLLDANVLHVSAVQPASRTEAWPVPTHDQLHLRLDAASKPKHVELHDALGRLVLRQAVSTAEVNLDVAALPAGVYILKVQYALGGSFTRRVIRE
ncbi:T9SS type A sorting domain-containing protein [Hymenobacter volaticus]|uniref:T9SS type A sorting domain-containing protein n=1 Tax=Hymenobacter volaticus TaxID=2932254 RepID=A0ABY4G2E7_9BACT|nr:T9SS type A sorting domain-containing protein [Hymenobacter volaticus]UOQ65050.1 T9SS type A sorting domain-containing protein [Hymenobacter volaticus]